MLMFKFERFVENHTDVMESFFKQEKQYIMCKFSINDVLGMNYEYNSYTLDGNK